MKSISEAFPHKRLINALNKISEGISVNDCFDSSNVSLWSGNAGIALYLAGLQKINPDRATENVVQQLLSSALNTVSAYPVPQLFRNVWTIWAARAVDQLFDWSENTHFCNDLDELLLEALSDVESWEERYDLISGLISIGAYGLTATSNSCGKQIVERVMQLLLPMSRETSEYQWWLTSPRNSAPALGDRHPSGYSDLGLAHGNAGVLAFLARAVKQNVEVETASACLTKLVAWIVAQQNPAPHESHFPYIAEEGGKRSRCAWCYGDVGISWALASAGEAMHNPQWSRLGRDVAKGVIKRLPDSMGFVDDALCHGRAGVGHILARHTEFGDDPEISAFATEMFCKALLSIENDCADTTDKLQTATSFLEGRPGIGLALMSAADLQFQWDYPLLLS